MLRKELMKKVYTDIVCEVYSVVSIKHISGRCFHFNHTGLFNISCNHRLFDPLEVSLPTYILLEGEKGNLY